MPDSIKKQVMDRILADLATLVPATFVSVKRELNPLKEAEQMPSLMVYDGPETRVGQDSRGRIYQFPLGIRIWLADYQDLSSTKDVYVPQVQQKIEGDLQLGALANIVDGGEEHPFINEIGSPIC